MADGKQPAPPGEHGREADAVVRGIGTLAKRGRVLVVDDMEDNRDLYATFLEHCGFETDQAVNGEDALAKITEEPPDVVVMDLAMPKLDGWQATRLVKANPNTAHVIVIVVTGNATESNISAAHAAGADAVCRKPCLPKDLLATIEKHLKVRDGTGRV